QGQGGRVGARAAPWPFVSAERAPTLPPPGRSNRQRRGALSFRTILMRRPTRWDVISRRSQLPSEVPSSTNGPNDLPSLRQARVRAALLRRVSRAHVNTLIYLGSAALSKAASLFLIPIYTSRLSRAEYASFGLCQTLYWIGPPLATMALSSALARFYFDDTD